MNSVANRLMEYFKPHLGHQYQNVREAIGFMLVNMLEMDFQYPGGPSPEGPLVIGLMAEIRPRLELLMRRDFPVNAYLDQAKTQQEGENQMQVEEGAEDMEYLHGVRVFKTIAYYITTFINMSTNGNKAEYFELLPIACRLERCEHDPELASICTKLLSMLAHALTLDDCMSVGLQKVYEVSRVNSWWSRLAAIGVLEVMVFNNMMIVLSRTEWVEQVQEIVLRLLEDKVVEVRVKAAQVLGGLLHCKFLPSTDKLLELFKQKCQTKVTRTTAATMMAGGPEDIEG